MDSWTKGMWFDLQRRQQVQAVLNSGWVIDKEQIQLFMKATAWQIPWIFFGPHPQQNKCILWNDIYFDYFKLIPEFCRTRCHKVVAKPRSVRELFSIYEAGVGLDCPGKAGVDRRLYTFGPYAAFWYTGSMEEGQARYEEVKAFLKKHLPDGERIPLILKKGCTEMEDTRKGGLPSNQWKPLTPEERDLEDRLNYMFSQEELLVTQPVWLKDKIKLDWLEHAYSIGDYTYKEVLDQDIFGVHTLTYHPKEE